MRISGMMVCRAIVMGVILCAGAMAQQTVRVPELPDQRDNYRNIVFPQHFTESNPAFGGGNNAVLSYDNTPANNRISNAGATLGRVLFYDRNLSANRTISCGSCHHQEHGFSDPAVLSDGFEGGKTRRHSMGLSNARFYNNGRAFWDERAATLEEQALMPIQDPVEMGLTLEQLVVRVEEQPYYPQLFQAAFGSEDVTTSTISRAIAQFIRSMVSYQSKYDAGRAQVASPLDPFPNFTQSENRGKQLFLTPIPDGGLSCSACHNSEAQLGDRNQAQNNGLDAQSTDDLGVFETTGAPQDLGAFKVPSLRNIEVRGPYMHDGRFATLEEVVEFYNSGIQNHPNLSGRLLTPPAGPQGRQPVRFNLSAADKQAVVDFLKTLTDESFLNDPKFSDPFVEVQRAGVESGDWLAYW